MPLIVSLQRFIQGGIQRCLSVGSDTSQRSDFQFHIARPDCQQACHAAVELEEVLLQVGNGLWQQSGARAAAVLRVTMQHLTAVSVEDCHGTDGMGRM